MNPNSIYFDMVRHRPRDRHESVQTPRQCASHQCLRPATHKAPAPKGQTGTLWLCLDHVREYNRAYDFFSDMSEAEISAYQREDIFGHRPTWRLGSWGAFPSWQSDMSEILRMAARIRGARDPHAEGRAPKTPSPREKARRRALASLQLPPHASMETIRMRFKELVKRYHPDRNNGDRSHEKRLAEVLQSYQLLKQEAAAERR